MNQILTHERAGLKANSNRVASFFNGLMALTLFFFTGSAYAQILVAVDDSFGVPSNVLSGEPFVVEDPGVLKNDTLDSGQGPKTDFGGMAELVTSVSGGTLSCPGDGALELCANGSFQYTSGSGFSGSDSFTYQVSYAGLDDIATVTLAACTEDVPLIFSCWKEFAYRSKLAELGYRTFEEGFEGHAWDSVRSTLDNNTAPAITSQGITWTTNHPSTNDITTDSGAARTGLWGGYDPNHGFATGTIGECDVEFPLEHCFPHDGLSGSIQPGGDPVHGSLQGVGGYFSSNTGGGTIAIVLYGGSHSTGAGTLINVGKLPHAASTFFGVIDATASGFTGFEFRELDGKVEQQAFVFGDDFTIATSAGCMASGYDIPAGLWAKFGLPCDIAPNNTVADIFTGANTDSLNSDDYGINWVVFNRNASVQEYVELSKTDALTEGKGYWVFSTNATTVGVSGSPQSFADIDLVSAPTGRVNYIGHNQEVSVDWTTVQVVDGASVLNYGEYDVLKGSVYDCDPPVQPECVMSRKMHKWNGAAYQVFDGITPDRLGTLDPFDGAWVHAFKPGIKLRIPVSVAATAIATATSASVEQALLSVKEPVNTQEQSDKKPKKPKKPKYEPWYIRLTVSSGNMVDPGNVLGQLGTATEGNDPHDLEEPVPFDSKYLSALFTNPLFEQVDWGFTTDFRALTKRPRGVWPFVVKAHVGISEVTIHWEGKDDLFKNTWLVDEENGKFIRAKAGESYTVEIEGGEHRFRFEVGEKN
jgi:hypothetical protein